MKPCACLAVVVALLISGCGEDAVPPSTGPKVKALPFAIEEVMLSDAFQNNLKVAKVHVGVTGGDAEAWAATSIAIAEKVASFGVDSIEVSVRRNEIVERRGISLREVAHAYYSPNPDRTVWSGDKQWAIYLAEPEHLATQKDVAVYEEFIDLNERMIEKGVDPEAADKKAGSVIAKKYGLPKDWRLPSGNIWFNGPGFDRSSITVDQGAASLQLQALQRCMDGKRIYGLSSCAEK
jgi:hypothetical protein